MVDQVACRQSREACVAALRERAPTIAPSMLLCDFANLAGEIRRLEDAGIELLHLDVMDGHFVPNLTYGLPIVEAVRRSTRLPIDVHLMIAEPSRYVEAFHRAGADVITIHVEAVDDPRPLLERIRELGAVAGVALNPDTPLERIAGCTDACDLVLAMSVMPGFGGQAFERIALDKLRDLRRMVPDRVLLEIDGGVNDTTIGACVAAGADLLVVGSAIFKHADYADRIRRLRQLTSKG